ncbi:MAG: hypothetical protein HOQ28_04215 [Thermoleophilia bacterium]|nr:hypothetical protein [Thermoleophilia bacterium]
MATLAWAALEPVDKRLFRHDYSDVALLGKFATRTRAWPIVGLAIHAANGAVFGLAFDAVRRRTSAEPRRVALALALAENFALFPLSRIVDRRHPARGEPGLAPLFSGRGLAQSTTRHIVFGIVLGRLASRSG